MGSHAGLAGMLPHIWVALFLSLFFCELSLAQPATLKFQDCFSGGNLTEKLDVTTVYAQVIGDQLLNLTIVGNSNIPIVGRSSTSTKLGAFPKRLC